MMQARDLIGATVTSALNGEMDMGIEAAPVLILRMGDGRRFIVGVWQDEEGNGPGYLAINDWDGPEVL